ncbi:MAG: CopG family transcriptional regulator [Chloroflexi bacterium]|nr:CopG family transcriptional regulator [Chloroflexota bacterium]
MKTLPKRATVYFDPQLHSALAIKAAQTEQSVSDLVNDAVRLALAEETADLAAFAERAHEPDIPLADVLKKLKAHGRL